jgi:hypothetical protein
MPDPDPLWWIRMRKPAGSKNDTEDWFITKLVNWKCYCKNWISFMERRVKEFTVCFLAVDWSQGNNDRKTSGLVRYTVHSIHISAQVATGTVQTPKSYCKQIREELCGHGCDLWAFHSWSLSTPSPSTWQVWIVSVSQLVFLVALLTCDCLSGYCKRFSSFQHLFLLLLLDRWVSAWELWAFHFLSLSTPSLSTWQKSVCLRIASISLLVTIYFFSLYLTGECLPENCSVSLLVTIFSFFPYLTGEHFTSCHNLLLHPLFHRWI